MPKLVVDNLDKIDPVLIDRLTECSRTDWIKRVAKDYNELLHKVGCITSDEEQVALVVMALDAEAGRVWLTRNRKLYLVGANDAECM